LFRAILLRFHSAGSGCLITGRRPQLGGEMKKKFFSFFSFRIQFSIRIVIAVETTLVYRMGLAA